MSNLCVVCLDATNTLHSVLEKTIEHYKNIYEMLIFCVPKLTIIGESIDNSYICNLCLYELTTCVNFIEKCIKSNTVIRRMETCKNNKSTDKYSLINNVVWLDFAPNQTDKSNSANETSGITEVELPNTVIIEDDIEIKPEPDIQTKFEVEDEAELPPEDQIEYQGEVELTSMSENEVDYDIASVVDFEVQSDIESESKTEIIDQIDVDGEMKVIVLLDSEDELAAERKVAEPKRNTRNCNEVMFLDVGSADLVDGASEHSNCDVSSINNPLEPEDALALPKSSEQPVRHKCTLHKCKRLYCEDCNVTYCEFRKHKCQLDCLRCEYIFTSKEELETHINYNKDEEECRFACPHCPLMLSRDEIDKHKKAHPTVQCTICSKLFNSKSSLKAHLSVHNEREFQCPKCEASFKAKSGLRHHINYKHKKLKPILCDQCPKRFYTNCSLRLHKSSAHDKIVSSMCPECGQTFVARSSLEDHYRVIHLNQRRFCCEVCGRLFGRKDNMLKHARICKNRAEGKKNGAEGKKNLKFSYSNLRSDIPVECVYCKKILKSLSNLIVHVKAMHLKSPRPFKCETCPLQFSAKPSLTKHELIHKDPDCKFRCDVCYKKFKDSDELDKHMSEKHKKMPYECDECGEKFARRFLLENHQYSFHNSEQIFATSCKAVIDAAIKHAESKGSMKCHYKPRKRGMKGTDTSEDIGTLENKDDVDEL